MRDDARYYAGSELAQEAARNQRSIDDAKHLAECRKWLIDRGIVNSRMTPSEWRKATACYRQRIGKTARPGPRDWAGVILSRHADGDKKVTAMMLEMAKSAMAQTTESEA